MENTVSALSTDSPAFALLHEESKRQTALLEHMSKLAEDQLNLQHELVKLARFKTVGAAQAYNAQMLASSQTDTARRFVPLRMVPNKDGLLPSAVPELPLITSGQALLSMDQNALSIYLEFYRIPDPTVFLAPTAARKAGLCRYVLARHLGCHGIAGSAAAEFGGSDDFV